MDSLVTYVCRAAIEALFQRQDRYHKIIRTVPGGAKVARLTVTKNGSSLLGKPKSENWVNCGEPKARER